MRNSPSVGAFEWMRIYLLTRRRAQALNLLNIQRDEHHRRVVCRCDNPPIFPIDPEMPNNGNLRTELGQERQEAGSCLVEQLVGICSEQTYANHKPFSASCLDTFDGGDDCEFCDSQKALFETRWRKVLNHLILDPALLTARLSRWTGMPGRKSAPMNLCSEAVNERSRTPLHAIYIFHLVSL